MNTSPAGKPPRPEMIVPVLIAAGSSFYDFHFKSWKLRYANFGLTGLVVFLYGLGNQLIFGRDAMRVAVECCILAVCGVAVSPFMHFVVQHLSGDGLNESRTLKDIVADVLQTIPGRSEPMADLGDPGKHTWAVVKLGTGTAGAILTDRNQAVRGLKLGSRRVNDVTILAVSGKLVLGEPAAILREVFRGLVAAEQNRIILNLAQISHIDSAGVGVLVEAFTEVGNSGGRVAIVGLTKRVRRLSETGFQAFVDEASAIRSFEASNT